MTSDNLRLDSAARLRQAVASEAYDDIRGALADYRGHVEAALAGLPLPTRSPNAGNSTPFSLIVVIAILVMTLPQSVDRRRQDVFPTRSFVGSTNSCFIDWPFAAASRCWMWTGCEHGRGCGNVMMMATPRLCRGRCQLFWMELGLERKRIRRSRPRPKDRKTISPHKPCLLAGSRTSSIGG